MPKMVRYIVGAAVAAAVVLGLWVLQVRQAESSGRFTGEVDAPPRYALQVGEHLFHHSVSLF